MPRNVLRETQVKSAAKPGLLADGDGLYLSVSKTGAKSWRYIYVRGGKRTELGLGSYGTGTEQVSLAAARDKADGIRAMLGAGGDPKSTPKETPQAPVTFGKFADDFIATMESGWRNAKHRQQWKNSLKQHAPVLREKPIAEITVDDVIGVLKPIWVSKAETASRIRGRIETILDAAKVSKLREGENPARWKGNLVHLLPKRKKLQRGHHKALPYAEMPEFIKVLRKKKGIASKALEFTTLTAARSGEVREAVWPEIDFNKKIWTVPAEKMKAEREHRVPLCSRAIEILNEMKEISTSDLIFPGEKSGKTMSDMTLSAVLRRMKIDATVHGMRSSFRDWVGDETDHPSEVGEAALAHAIGDETEEAYRRGDALEKRRKLMDDWANYCGSAN
jgi:integrase